jgi:hypothetical protein
MKITVGRDTTGFVSIEFKTGVRSERYTIGNWDAQLVAEALLKARDSRMWTDAHTTIDTEGPTFTHAFEK